MGLLQKRLSFADGDATFQWQKGEQFVKSPDPAQSVRMGAFLPKLLKVPERFRWSEFVPIVFDIEKFAADGTVMLNLFDSELFPARWIDALLIN